MQQRTIEASKNGKDVLYDATNMTRKDRAHIISTCKAEHISVSAIVIWAPYETCIERDAKRSRTEGQSVIRKMIKRYQAPFYDEGFCMVSIYNNMSIMDKAKYTVRCYEDMCIPHDNPHHTLNIQEHCSVASTLVKMNPNNIRGFASTELLKEVALYHDIGKPFCKSFKDTKSNDCDIAHYYNHENVSGWMAHGISDDPYFAWLISNHMEPFHNSKYFRSLQKNEEYKEAYNDLMRLHEADKAAH